MQSLFWAVAIYGLIATWIAYRRKMEGLGEYTVFFCMTGYLLSRGFVWLQLKHMGAASWEAGLLDAGIFLLLVWITEKSRERFEWEYVWLYVSNPVVLLSLSTIKKTGVTALLFVFLLTVRRIWGKEKWKSHSIELYRYYFRFTVCGVLYLRARMLYGQYGIQCITEEENYPWAWLIAVILLLATGIAFVRDSLRWKRETGGAEACLETRILPEKTEKKMRVVEHMGLRDIIWLLILTTAYAGVVFFRIGSMEAPQSYLKLDNTSEENSTMVFDLGADTAISEIEIYIGVKGKRSMSFAYYDEGIDNWYVFEEGRKIESVFTWNTVPVKRMSGKLKLQIQDKEAYIYEVVILDKKGNRILPVNWQEYAEAFDEQELYPLYTTYYEGSMFDEVYHARTAYEFVHDLPLYEITHPPLGKLFISLGIRACGMTPFGWRVVCAMFGTAMVPLMYLFAHRLFGMRKMAVFSTVLFCLEFMHLTLSRIATLDIIVAFFVLGMFYFMYLAIAELRKKGLTLRQTVYLFLCGGFSACAVSVKWTGFYALAGIAVLFLGYLIAAYASSRDKLLQNRKLLTVLCIRCVGAFVVLPVTVYFLSYIPYMWCGYTENFIKIAVDNFFYMLNYHKEMVFSHPYASEWYEWLWMKQPLVDAFTTLEKGKVSSVVTMGHPLIWWGGAAAFVHNVYLWRCKKEKVAAYLCIAYIAMLLPWLFIYRTVFIYQYFICSNLLVLLLGNSFCYIGKHREKAMLGFVALAGVLFVCFYPVLTGYPVAAEYVNRGLEWFKSWVMA